MSIIRTPYPSDVSDEEWAFVAPYLTLLAEDAGQRKYPVREVFTRGLQWPALHREDRRPLAHAAPRSAAVAERLSTDVALDGCRLLRGHSARRQLPTRVRATLDAGVIQNTLAVPFIDAAISCITNVAIIRRQQ